MIQLVMTALSVVLFVGVLLIGAGSSMTNAIERSRLEVEARAGYAAILQAVDAYRIANRGAPIASGAPPLTAPLGDLGPYLPVAPILPPGMAWSISGGESGWVCASGQTVNAPVLDGLGRIAGEFGGRLGTTCGGASASVVADGPAAATLPLSGTSLR